MKANDIVCYDTQKTRIELDLDMLYGKLVNCLNEIFNICELGDNFLDEMLDSGKISQTELDLMLMSLIDIIKYEKEV